MLREDVAPAKVALLDQQQVVPAELPTAVTKG